MSFFKFIFFVAFAFYISTSAFASEASPTKSPISDCSAGGALDMYFCFDKQLEILEDQISDLLIEVENSINSSWGDDANIEIKKRVRESQKAWLEYRDAHCEFYYYTKAPSHPPSQSLSMTVCKYRKTEARLKEIKENYLNLKD